MKKINWASLLGFATGVNIAVGLMTSPATSLRKVEVYGALPTDESRIRTLFSRRANAATMRLSLQQIQSELKANPDVDRAAVAVNCLGRGRVDLFLKKPIGHVKSEENPNLALMSDGSVVDSSQKLEDLAEVSLPDTDFAFGIAGGWNLRAVAELTQWLGPSPTEEPWKIALDPEGSMSAQTGKLARIIFGTPTDLKAKFAAYQTVLKNQSNVLERNKELNVSAPSRPTVR